jgi:transcriptional regulator with XRE-family HTH domain
MPTFGELLRRLRGLKSQKAVASELDMPVTTLSSLENQSQVPRGPLLEKLANYYGVPLTYFFPSPTSEPKPTDSAREWLKTVSQNLGVKDGIAAHAPPEYPDKIKKHFAEKIREKKHAKTRSQS